MIATARPENEVFARVLGAAQTIDHTREDLVESVRAAHPDGIDAVIDVISDGEALDRIARLLKQGGRLASSVFAADIEGLARRGIQATNVSMQPDARRLEELSRMVDAGELSVRLERTFPLERAPEALGESNGHVRGRSYFSSTEGANTQCKPGLHREKYRNARKYWLREQVVSCA